MQPKIIFTGSTANDQTNTGDAFVTITRNPNGSVKFEAVTQTDVSEKAEGKDLRGAKIS